MEPDQKQMLNEFLNDLEKVAPEPDKPVDQMDSPDDSPPGKPVIIDKTEPEPAVTPEPDKVEPDVDPDKKVEPEPEPEPEPAFDPEDRDKIIEDLRNQLNNITGQFDFSAVADVIAPVDAPAAKPEDKPVVEPDKPAPVPRKQTDFDPEDWLTTEELDNVVDNPKLINTALNRVMSRVFNRVADVFQPILDGLDGRLKEVPAQVTKTVQAQSNTNSMMEQFYKSNDDLLPYAKFTNFTIASEARAALASKEEVTMDQLFERAGEKVRLNLRLKPKSPPQKSAETKPALPGARTTRTTKPTVVGEPTQQEFMAEIMLGGDKT